MIVVIFSTAEAQAELDYTYNDMRRFYWVDDDACFDKKDNHLWISALVTVPENPNGWNPWEIFDAHGEYTDYYWWWGVWDPLDPRPDIDWDPYWGNGPDQYARGIAIERLLERIRISEYTIGR